VGEETEERIPSQDSAAVVLIGVGMSMGVFHGVHHNTRQIFIKGFGAVGL
jgi:hypothetical protein